RMTSTDSQLFGANGWNAGVSSRVAERSSNCNDRPSITDHHDASTAQSTRLRQSSLANRGGVTESEDETAWFAKSGNEWSGFDEKLANANELFDAVFASSLAFLMA